jgi:hypothetical protein
MRGWLEHGAIDDSPQLEIDLTDPQYHHNSQDELILESKEDMKKRGLDSPDSGDALALTFAQPVEPREDQQEKHRNCDPYDEEEQEYYGSASMTYDRSPGAWMR